MWSRSACCACSTIWRCTISDAWVSNIGSVAALSPGCLRVSHPAIYNAGMSIEPYEDVLVKMARNRKRAALATVAIKILLLLDIDVVRMMFWL